MNREFLPSLSDAVNDCLFLMRRFFCSVLSILVLTCLRF